MSHENRVRVAVLFGGRSDEHPISCATAAGVLAAIDRDRYEVVPIGITRSGEWVAASDDPDQWRISAGRVPEVTGSDSARVMLPMGEPGQDLVAYRPGSVPAELSAVDVVLPLLHGPFGEDG